LYLYIYLINSLPLVGSINWVHWYSYIDELRTWMVNVGDTSLIYIYTCIYLSNKYCTFAWFNKLGTLVLVYRRIKTRMVNHI